MFKFILASAIILVLISKKLFFLGLEDEYVASLPAVIDLASVIVPFCIAVYLFMRKFQKNKLAGKRQKISQNKFDAISIGLFVAIIVVLGTAFQINLRKISIHWDAIALYDARAKFLEDGMKFSEMPALSEYDNQNKYYYLLYPPYTSIGHLFWRNSVILTDIPVSVYYSIYLTLLSLIIVFTTKEYLGLRASLLLALIVVSNNNIFNITIKEYTNLPFTLHIVGGVLFLSSYIKSRRSWELLLGIILISTSLWIRLLEPIWVAVGLAFAGALLTRKRLIRNLWPFAVLMSVGIVQYLSWIYFVKVFAGNPGFINYSLQTMIEPFLGLFTGALFVVVPTVIKTWGLSFLVHFFAISALVIRYKYVVKNKVILFLGLVIVFSISLYLTEFYLLSFQYDWWSIVAMSLGRSSTFLIPISAYLLIWSIINSKFFFRKR